MTNSKNNCILPEFVVNLHYHKKGTAREGERPSTAVLVCYVGVAEDDSDGESRAASCA